MTNVCEKLLSDYLGSPTLDLKSAWSKMRPLISTAVTVLALTHIRFRAFIRGPRYKHGAGVGWKVGLDNLGQSNR